MKYITYIFVLSTLLFSSLNYATEIIVPQSFKNTLITSFMGNNVDMREDFIINNRRAIRLTWKDRYGDKGNKARTFYQDYGKVVRSGWGTQDYSNGKYVSLAPQSEIDAGMGYQCVGFVKAGSSIPSNWQGRTTNWNPTQRVTYGNFPPMFTPIATFRDTDYDGNVDAYIGHVAYFFNGDRDGIWVIDQNWSDRTGGQVDIGSMAYHFIPYSNLEYDPSRRVDTNDANNYYVFNLND